MNHRSDILFFFGVLLALWTAYLVRDVLLLIYVSALFAVVLSPAIGVIQRDPLSHPGDVRGGMIIVSIAERPAQLSGKRTTDSGLPCSSDPHQNDDQTAACA
jgi:hypothetical protein